MTNKTFQKGVEDYGINLQYPLSQKAIDELPKCDIVNPITINDPRVVVSPQEMWTPILPSDPRFDDLFMETLIFDKTDVVLPKCFTDNNNNNRKYTPRTNQQYADIVHKDRPTELIQELIIWLRETQNVKVRKELFPQKNYKVWSDPMVEHIVGWAIETVHHTAFAHKYYYGTLRPEEYAFEWASGRISSKYDRLYEKRINKEAVLEDMRSFTLYPEGSPNHPSLGAMHSAVAALPLILAVLFKLNKFQKEQCKLTGRFIADCRTIARVHYIQDNDYGLDLGETAIEKILPAKLAEWGADPQKVLEVVKANRTEWRSYKPAKGH